MKTVSLHPEHIGPLAQTLYTEWYDFALRSSVSKIRVYYETCLRGSGLPVAFAAVDGRGRLLGPSALKQHDIAALPQYKYWLGDVFVLPPYRGKDVGKLLVEHYLGAAHGIRLPTFYLYTPDMQAVYEKYGWRETEWRRYNGGTVSVMRLGL